MSPDPTQILVPTRQNVDLADFVFKRTPKRDGFLLFTQFASSGYRPTVLRQKFGRDTPRKIIGLRAPMTFFQLLGRSIPLTVPIY